MSHHHTQNLPAPARDGLRIGDRERQETADVLAEHHAAGRLSYEELDERLGTAWTARTAAELDTLTGDLPALPRKRPERAERRGPSTGAWIGMGAHAASYLGVIVMLWMIWLLTGAGYPWPIWPTMGWGIGLLGHAGGIRAIPFGGCHTGRQTAR
jgi:hypothetical protein